jgi:hypothetical protein
MNKNEKDFLKMKRRAEAMPNSLQAEWMHRFRGMQFKRKGKIYPRFYVYLWVRATGLTPSEFFEVSDKPGWKNGTLKSVKQYNNYLENVTFA